MLHFSQRDKAYSLTELVTTMLVISVIMGIAIPNYRGMRLNADASKAEMNLNSIYLAQQEYHYDNDTYAVDGQMDELRTYVDFALDDGSWEYHIIDASTGANAFAAEAWHLTLMTPTRRTVRIDQTGSLTRNF